MNTRNVIAVVTAATGDRVILTEEAIRHVIDEHFRGVPQEIILETAELVLRDPSDVYRDSSVQDREYDFFYRLESGQFLVAIVKVIAAGAYLLSMYPTGKKQRTKHRKFKRVKL